MPRERQRARTAVDRVPRSLRPDGATQRQREGRCSLGDGLERTASGRQLTAGRGTTARRGDAAATRMSGATAGKTSGWVRGPRATLTTARRGDATAARGSVQPRGRPGADGLGAAADRGPRHYGPKGRRSGNKQVCATTGTASGRRRGPCAATLRPEGATQRRRGSVQPRGEPRGGGAAARRGDAAAARCSIGGVSTTTVGDANRT